MESNFNLTHINALKDQKQVDIQKMFHKQPKQTGIALISSLFILIILTILGLSFAAIAIRDLNFAKRQEINVKALFLARAGVEYFMVKGLPEKETVDSTPKIYPLQDKKYYCEFEIKGKLLYSKGVILNSSNNIVAKRMLVSPLWKLGEVYEIGENK